MLACPVFHGGGDHFQAAGVWLGRPGVKGQEPRSSEEWGQKGSQRAGFGGSRGEALFEKGSGAAAQAPPPCSSPGVLGGLAWLSLLRGGGVRAHGG